MAVELKSVVDDVSSSIIESLLEDLPFGNNPSLTFPLENANDYKGKIVFTAVEIPPVSTAALVNLDRSMEESEKRNIKKQNEAIGDDSEITEENVKQVKEAATEIRGENPDFQTFENNQGVRKKLGSVSLFLPQSIQIRDAVQYDNVELGTIGAAVGAGLKGGGALGNELINSLASTIGNDINSFVDSFSVTNTMDTPLARLGLTRVASRFGDGVGGAVQLQTRVSVNPNTRALFKSVALREMPFTFRMVATSQKEAEEIKKIIKFFRSELYPGEISDDKRRFTIGYKMPNLFEITMMYDNKPIATKFLDSYLRDVSVTYNSGGASMHSDGNFTDVEVTLSFVESRTMSKKDIKEGY